MPSPNVVFLFPDQLGARFLPMYGDPNIQTPHLDRLAAQSLRIDQCVSPCPVCTPYRASLITGRYPQTTGHIINSTVTRHDEISIGDAFAAAGYRTAWIGKWHLHRGAWPANNVPDWVPEGRDRMGFQHWRAYNQHMVYHNGFVNGEDWRPLHWEGYETNAINRFAFEFLDEVRQPDEPFLMFLSPQPPHWGLPPTRMAPEQYYERVPDDIVLRDNVPGHMADDARRSFREYYAMIAAVDDMVGDLLAGLEQRGLLNDTVFVFTSDHGTQGGAHGVPFWRKMHPHEESMHVPLLIRWPGVFEPGTTSQAMTTAVDLLPTLCGLCGVPCPDGVEGLDLSEAWKGVPGATERTDTLIMNFGKEHDYFVNGQEWRGVRTPTHTYARWLDGRVELYDLYADPLQLHNLADDSAHAALRDELEARMLRLLAERGDGLCACEDYRDWHDTQRRVIRNAFGPLPHPESEPDWSRLKPTPSTP
ncbi:MAG: sulfatase [Planctomycetota bacterium]